jgi:group I intron endonuclease
MRPYYGFVYLTTNLINGKRYIGQTTRKESTTYFGSGKAIRKALAKYGKENFAREVLIYTFNKVDLDFLETHCIGEYKALDARNWYNIAAGGKTTRGFTGKNHSSAHKEAVRQFMLTSHPNKGKQFSEEVCKRMSAAKLGNKSKSSPEGREQTRQLGLANKGKQRTDEERAAMSKFRRERPGTHSWTVQTPDGNIVTDKLSVWCKENGIVYSSLMNTLRTKTPHGKTGYMILERVKLDF